MRVAGGKARPQGEAHPPVPQPDMAAPRWGAGRSGQPRWVRSADGASHRLLSCAPPARRFPSFDSTENSGEPIHAPGAPLLKITRAGNTFILTWPVASVDFVLEETPRFTPRALSGPHELGRAALRAASSVH